MSAATRISPSTFFTGRRLATAPTRTTRLPVCGGGSVSNRSTSTPFSITRTRLAASPSASTTARPASVLFVRVTSARRPTARPSHRCPAVSQYPALFRTRTTRRMPHARARGRQSRCCPESRSAPRPRGSAARRPRRGPRLPAPPGRQPPKPNVEGWAVGRDACPANPGGVMEQAQRRSDTVAVQVADQGQELCLGPRPAEPVDHETHTHRAVANRASGPSREI